MRDHANRREHLLTVRGQAERLVSFLWKQGGLAHLGEDDELGQFGEAHADALDILDFLDSLTDEQLRGAE